MDLEEWNGMAPGGAWRPLLFFLSVFNIALCLCGGPLWMEKLRAEKETGRRKNLRENYSLHGMKKEP